MFFCFFCHRAGSLLGGGRAVRDNKRLAFCSRRLVPFERERERESLACNIYTYTYSSCYNIAANATEWHSALHSTRVVLSLEFRSVESVDMVFHKKWVNADLYTLLFKKKKLIDIGRDWSPALARINCGFTPGEPNFHTNCFVCFLFLSFSDPEDFNVLHFRTWRFRKSWKKKVDQKKTYSYSPTAPF